MPIDISNKTEIFINEIKEYIYNADKNITFNKTFSIIDYGKDGVWSGVERRISVDKLLTRFYERFLSIIPANPNKKKVVDAINSLTKENDVYATICNVIDDFVCRERKQEQEQENIPLHLFESARGNGKSTAQNYFIVNNLLKLEDKKNIIIRCDVHKVWNILHYQSNGNDFNISIERYLLFQTVYVIIKYSTDRTIYEKILGDLTDIPIETSKGYVNIPDCSFSTLVESIKLEIKEEITPHNNFSQNSAMMDLLQKACSDDKSEATLAQKKLEEWEKIGNEIYNYFTKNNFKLINFIDGIDNMYWFAKSKKPRKYFTTLIESLVRMVENYSNSARCLDRLFLVFIRPETTAYISSQFTHSNALSRHTHEPYIHKCSNSSFIDIINMKISLLNQELSYFESLKKEAGKAFDSLHYIYDSQGIDKSTIPPDEICCWNSINKRRFKVLKDLDWVGEIKSLLEKVSEMNGPTEHLSSRPVYRYEEKTALEDMSNNNLRSISFNMIQCSSYINPTHIETRSLI